MHKIIVNIAKSLKKTELFTSKGHEEALKTLLEKANGINLRKQVGVFFS